MENVPAHKFPWAGRAGTELRMMGVLHHSSFLFFFLFFFPLPSLFLVLTSVKH